MKDKAIYQMLGLAARARKLITGEELVLKEVKNNKAKLVLISSDASANTLKKVTDKCTYYNVEYFVFSDRYTLGHAIGKDARVTIALMDDGFAKKLSGLLNESNRG